MKKIMFLILSITFVQSSNISGMFFKKNPVLTKKNILTKIKHCSNKNASFNYDEIIFNTMKQMTTLEQKNRFLHQENTFLKLEVECLLMQQRECESKIDTHGTINFVSRDKRSSGDKE